MMGGVTGSCIYQEMVVAVAGDGNVRVMELVSGRGSLAIVNLKWL